jgi:hypothetical protein
MQKVLSRKTETLASARLHKGAVEGLKAIAVAVYVPLRIPQHRGLAAIAVDVAAVLGDHRFPMVAATAARVLVVSAG